VNSIALALALVHAAQASGSAGTELMPSEDIIGRWYEGEATSGFARQLDPHLSEDERRTLREIVIRIRPGPAPEGDACRQLATFAYVERQGGRPRINLCLRNMTLFGIFNTSLMMGMLISPRYQSETDYTAYARAVSLVYERIRDEPNFSLARPPCMFPEYIYLRQTNQNVARCVEGSLRPGELETWLNAHPDFFDMSRLQQLAQFMGRSVNETIDVPGRALQAQFVLVIYYFILHEAGHVHLRHSMRARGSVCERVREEHAADQFARRLILAPDNGGGSLGLDISSLSWIMYQAGTHEFSGDETATGLDLVRLQSMVMNFIDALPNLTPAQRAMIEAGRPPGSPTFEEGRRQFAALRTCLTSNQPMPDGAPPPRPPR
jgi:hypothetical protein